MPETVTWNHRDYALTPFRDGWRIRSRARGNEFDWQFPACSVGKARELALARFEESSPGKVSRGVATLEEVVKAYLELPKRASAVSAYNNVTRLRAVVKLATGKALDRVLVTDVGRLWNAFFAAKLGGRLDLATRRPGNTALNSAVRSASSIFIPRLRPLYKERGIIIPDDATLIQWLPEMKLVKAQVNGDDLERAWSRIQGSPLYFAIGLARFAGLRQQEISACRRNWIVEYNGAVYIEMRDRPEERFLSKTGEIYRALVTHAGFAAALLARGEGRIVDVPLYSTPGAMEKNITTNRGHWFQTYPQAWLKPFTGRERKPLHRLRGLYADEVARLEQDAVAARLAGVKAASQALGHTSTRTTEESYLSS